MKYTDKVVPFVSDAERAQLLGELAAAQHFRVYGQMAEESLAIRKT